MADVRTESKRAEPRLVADTCGDKPSGGRAGKSGRRGAGAKARDRRSGGRRRTAGRARRLSGSLVVWLVALAALGGGFGWALVKFDPPFLREGATRADWMRWEERVTRDLYDLIMMPVYAAIGERAPKRETRRDGPDPPTLRGGGGGDIERSATLRDAMRRAAVATAREGGEPVRRPRAATAAESTAVTGGAGGKIREIELLLAELWISPGRIDGREDPDLREAIARYQTIAGLPRTGRPTQRLLDHLRWSTGRSDTRLPVR